LGEALLKINRKQFRQDVVARHCERDTRVLAVLGGLEEIPQSLGQASISSKAVWASSVEGFRI
jgi:hypothetical protein